MRITITIFLIVAVGIYAWMEFTRGHVNLNSQKADFKVEAEDLLSAFETDEAEANKKYLGKIIELEGEVIKLDKPEKGIVNVLLSAGDRALGGINSSFQVTDSDPINSIQPGTRINVKGECSGYLLDVILVRCVLVDS